MLICFASFFDYTCEHRSRIVIDIVSYHTYRNREGNRKGRSKLRKTSRELTWQKRIALSGERVFGYKMGVNSTTSVDGNKPDNFWISLSYCL